MYQAIALEKPTKLNGNVVLVTGGSQGIGQAITIYVAEEGAIVAKTSHY